MQWSRIKVLEGGSSNPGDVILLDFVHFFFLFIVFLIIFFSLWLVPFIPNADPLKLREDFA